MAAARPLAAHNGRVPRSTTALLNELDGLAYADRMALFVRRSRELGTTGELAVVLADLRAGTAYERFLALTAGLVVGDRDAVTGALDDPHRPIRATAVKACLRAGWLSGAGLRAFVADAPADLRRLVYRSLRRGGLSAAADALIDIVQERYGDVEAAALLPACGPDTVRRLLPEVDHVWVGWPALARRHGGVFVDYAASVLAAAGGRERSARWAVLVDGVLVAAQDRPLQVLELLERYAPATRLPGDLAGYGVLAAFAPERVARLLTAPGRAGWLARVPLPPAVLRRLARLDVPALVALGRRVRGDDAGFAALLRALPPARRGAIFEEVLADVDTAALVPGAAVLEVLPRRRREAAARRMLGLDRIRADERATLFWSGYLPWAEAEAAAPVAAAMRSADATDRAQAYQVMLSAARRSRDPAVVHDAVRRLDRLRNEQDPVRAAALSELATLPHLLRAESVPVLTGLVADAVQARDASTRTLSALGTLAAGVLRHHVDDPQLLGWALQTLDRLFGGHSLPPLGRFDLVLRRGQEAVVFARLRGWIEAGMARGRYTALFAVARSLGRRAWALDDLQALLRRAIDRDNVSAVVREAVTLWLADPAHRSQRVPQVLDVDPSTVTFPLVWDTISARRTDLLDRVLLGPAPAGRFLAAGTRWVPGRPRRVDRWLPRHRQAFVRLQADVAADAGTVVFERCRALGVAARVPEVGRDLVLRYVDSASVNLAEAALGALPWTDRPDEALPVLLGHADDDRARVALYAAGRAARFVRPSRLCPQLSGVLDRGKVTSRKAAVRLLAAYGPPEAMEVLLAAWQQPGQHRDVRAAIVTAARRRRNVPAGWQILEEAAAGGREEATALLSGGPLQLPEPHRVRYARLILAACRSADRVVARLAWADLPGWLPWCPGAAGVLVPGLRDLSEDRRVLQVADVVGALLDGARRGAADPLDDSGVADARVLDAALGELVRLDGADPDAGGPTADRPARRRIELIVEAMRLWAGRCGPDADRAPARRVARRLGHEPDFVPAAARLLTALIRPEFASPAQLVAEAVELADLLAGRPVLAARLAGEVMDRVTVSDATADPDVLLTAAGALARRGDAASGYLALALTRAGQAYGWSLPWRELLRGLRGHPVLEVRDTAFDVCMREA